MGDVVAVVKLQFPTPQRSLRLQDLFLRFTTSSQALCDAAHLLIWILVESSAHDSLCRPSARFLEPVNNFVHATSHAKVQWPTTVSILAKRTWTALKHNNKPGRRVNVRSAPFLLLPSLIEKHWLNESLRFMSALSFTLGRSSSQLPTVSHKLKFLESMAVARVQGLDRQPLLHA